MIKNLKQKNNSERGAVMMVAVIFFIAISTLVVLGLVGPSAREYKMANDSISAHQSYFSAESGVEDVYYRIKSGASTTLSEPLVLGNSYTTTIISGQDVIGTSNVFNQQRKVDLKINNGTKSFKYVAMAGDGGVSMGASVNLITGDLYSSGPITGVNGSRVSGSVASPSSSIAGTSGNPSSPVYVDGNIDVNSVSYTSAGGYIHCLSGTGNNKSCTGSPSVSVEAYPIPGSLIDQWKNDAVSGGSISGDYSIGSSGSPGFGPKKINGNLDVIGILNMTGTLWVTGNLNVHTSFGKIKLDTAYGAHSGIIIVDGTSTLASNGFINGSGVSGSYMVVVSTNSSTGTSPAIDVTGSSGSGAGVLYAPYGQISVRNNVSPKQVTAYNIVLNGTGKINFGSTFSSSTVLDFWRDFTGTSASYISGINSWKETQ